METITAEFMGKGEVKGTVFREVFRHKNIGIYFRSDGHFEVVKIRSQSTCSRIINGKTIDYSGKEVYPKGEKWGPNEKCCRDLTSAVNAFNLLCYSQAIKFHLDMNNPVIKDFKCF